MAESEHKSASGNNRVKSTVLNIKNLSLLQEALTELDTGFESMPAFQQEEDTESLRQVLMEVAHRMKDNFPYPHPLYAGQMLKPPHAIARLAYMLSLWINPNNHALDGGRASSFMEKEAVGQLAGMLGWRDYLGHLCGGGTMANLEALWVASQRYPQKKIAGSQMAHYTHSRLAGVLTLDFQSIAVDRRGRMDITALEKALQQGKLTGKEIGTVVVTLGSTALGAVDQLPAVLRLREKYGFRVHVDAAYGGYFKLSSVLGSEAQRAFDVISQVDSVAIDPHKHGLQPYGCGCILFRDPSVGAYYRHDSPYTYFSSDALHLGEISLECSRPGASAVALWATQTLLPLEKGGEFAQNLDACHQAADDLYNRLAGDDRFLPLMKPELDIVVWGMKSNTLSGVSEACRRLFSAAEQSQLYLALVELPAELVKNYWQDKVELDANHVLCLRSSLMKSEHLQWVPKIWEILERLAG